MRKNQKGFSLVEVIIVLLVIGALAAVGVLVMKKTNKGSSSSGHSHHAAWEIDENGWKANGTPPACPNPLTIMPPTDVTKADGILYPGQYRGTDYKPHGGFKFAPHLEVPVSVPMDAMLYKGSRYIEQGETQYLLVFIAPCGIMFKFDHLQTLTSKYQQIVDDNFPAAKVDDSTTTNLSKDIEATAGETIATHVGFYKSSNNFFDFGVYDLRSKNAISADSQWMAKHMDDHEYAPYAVCWLDLLGEEHSMHVKSLPPVDGKSGAISDYCKTSAGNTLTNTAGNPAN